MKCFWKFFHDWDRWSDPYGVPLYYVDDIGQKLNTEPITRLKQIRKCRKCNQFQERLMRRGLFSY